MSTAIDSDVLIELWNEDDSLNTEARSALDTALGRGVFSLRHLSLRNCLPLRLGQSYSLIPFSPKRPSRWIGISTRLSGAPRVAPSNSILQAEEDSAMLALAAFSPIS
jgi:hypothetical protein